MWSLSPFSLWTLFQVLQWLHDKKLVHELTAEEAMIFPNALFICSCGSAIYNWFGANVVASISITITYTWFRETCVVQQRYRFAKEKSASIAGNGQEHMTEGSRILVVSDRVHCSNQEGLDQQSYAILELTK